MHENDSTNICHKISASLLLQFATLIVVLWAITSYKWLFFHIIFPQPGNLGGASVTGFILPAMLQAVED